MKKRKLKFSTHDPLHPLDTETQTYGSRAFDPDMSTHAGLKTCAFVAGEICTTPSREWKKAYLEKKKSEVHK